MPLEDKGVRMKGLSSRSLGWIPGVVVMSITKTDEEAKCLCDSRVWV